MEVYLYIFGVYAFGFAGIFLRSVRADKIHELEFELSETLVLAFL